MVILIKIIVISLVLGKKVKNKLIYVGKVSLGKKRRLAELIMKKAKVKAYMDVNSRDVIYIKPDVKCIVKYLEVTENGLLRQPFVP